jgi:hypothetical protein
LTSSALKRHAESRLVPSGTFQEHSDVPTQPFASIGGDSALAHIAELFASRGARGTDTKEGKVWIFIESNPGTEGGAFFPNKEKGSPAEVWCKTLISKLRVECTGPLIGSDISVQREAIEFVE